ncbi:MAG: hypothetical protein IPK08_18260 [Bacteroidetes bacterium]|nr:hypothetical protein [Bacteroidota bacterium]
MPIAIIQKKCARWDKDRGSKSRSGKPSGARKNHHSAPDDNGSIRLNRYIPMPEFVHAEKLMNLLLPVLFNHR